MTKQCKDCNNTFTLEDGEISFYNSKNLQLPNRCKSCRDKRKSDPNNTTSSNNTINPKNIIQNDNNNNKFKQNILVIVAFLVFTIGSIFTNEISLEPQINSTETPNISIQTNSLEFRTEEYFIEHFNKHGSNLGHTTAENYLMGANNVINSNEALKRIQSDGDTAYFIEKTEEFVVVSTDNYIRTYFKPNDGINYFNRQ